MKIKEKIIEKINSIDDNETLEEILRLVSIESKDENFYEFDELELKKVEEGIEDAENGRVFTQEESDKLISEWLKEKSFGR